MKRSRTVLLLILIIALGFGSGIGFAIAKNRANQRQNDDTTTQSVNQDSSQSDTSDTDDEALSRVTPSTDKNRCDTTDLTASIRDKVGGGAAGSTIKQIALKNESKSSCTLYGYPGVSYIDKNGDQIGKPAQRASGTKEVKISLKPKKTAFADIKIPDAQNFANGTCESDAAQLKIYPPGNTKALTVPTNQTTWCPGFSVQPVQAN